MRDWVNEWVQEGELWVWQYANADRSWNGWHLSADPAGCRSIRNLLDRMSGGEACHRAMRLEFVSGSMLKDIGYDRPVARQFEKLTLRFEPGVDDLLLLPEDDRLVMTVGNKRLRRLASAFADVEFGRGDFGIASGDYNPADTWMFWWPPRASAQLRRKDRR